MQPKQLNYKLYALQAFAIFSGGHLITHGPLLMPWENPPVGQMAYIVAAIEWGIMGVLIVSLFAWATYKCMTLRAKP